MNISMNLIPKDKQIFLKMTFGQLMSFLQEGEGCYTNEWEELT